MPKVLCTTPALIQARNDHIVRLADLPPKKVNRFLFSRRYYEHLRPEMLSEANERLFLATDHFVGKGIVGNIRSYVGGSIRNAIVNLIRNRNVRGDGTGSHGFKKDVKEAALYFFGQNGRMPSIYELAILLEVPVEKLHGYQQFSSTRTEVSLDLSPNETNTPNTTQAVNYEVLETANLSAMFYAQPDRVINRNQVLQHLITAVEKIRNPSHRKIFKLRFFEDMQYKEIAEALDIPLGTVMSSLHKAKKALKEELPEEMKSLADNLM